jgi:cell division protease FtsH
LVTKDLVKELQAAGAEYGGVRPGFITQFLLAWVLPIAIMIGLWTFIGPRLGAAGESVLGFGKSRARLIADKTPASRSTTCPVATRQNSS